jgi:glycosyltransferase involved in cell wall biosynthesis
MIQPFVFIFGGTFSVKQVQALRKICTPTFQRAKQVENLREIIRLHRPQCWLTVGGHQSDFPALFNGPVEERCRWMHYDSVDQLMERLPLIVNIFVNGVFAIRDELPREKVSAFTTSYNSKQYIHRPLETLLKQTHQNWEWVIYDDSDGDDNWKLLTKIQQRDPTRIRIFRGRGNSGVIGNVKQIASSLCRGDFILELDHDDELAPEAFEYLVAAARRYPEAGFFYSDYCFIHEDGRNSEHADGFALGFGGYRRRWSEQFDKWVNISRTVPITDITIRYLVGCPNHYRAWRTKTFHEIGGWCPDFHVADDYEILVRTFLNTTMCRVSYRSYTQYVNTPTKTSKNTFNNFTWLRNEQIQVLWKSMARSYNDRIHERLITLQGSDPHYETWETTAKPISVPYHATAEYYEKLNLVYEPRDQNDATPLVFIVLCYDPRTSLDGGSGATLYKAIAAMQAQTYQNIELMIVSANAKSVVEPLMDGLVKENQDEETVRFVQDHVSYWNFETKDTPATKDKPEVKATPHPYYMCVNHCLKRINTARHTMFLQDDNSFETIPPNFIAIALKYLKLRDDVHGLVLEPVPHVLYRSELHQECGFLDESRDDLVAVLQHDGNNNIVEFSTIEGDIESLEALKYGDDENNNNDSGEAREFDGDDDDDGVGGEGQEEGDEAEEQGDAVEEEGDDDGDGAAQEEEEHQGGNADDDGDADAVQEKTNLLTLADANN